MNEQANREHLLREVLAEETDAGFRAALLAQTLGLAGRRRRWRQARRAAATVCIILGLAALTLQFGQPHSGRPESPACAVVDTHPLAVTAVVATHPFAQSPVLTSSSDAVLVQTPPRGQYRDLDDRGLLEVAAPNPAVLVRNGPHQAELVFVSASGEQAPQD